MPGKNQDTEIDVSLTTQGSYGSAYFTIRNLELQYYRSVRTTDSTVTFVGLSPATTYEFQVQLTIGQNSQNGNFFIIT